MLSKFKPSKTLWVSPMRCEYIAAEIRNQTVTSMRQDDEADVAYRYLQTRRGVANCMREAVCWSSCAALILAYLEMNKNANKALLFLSFLICAFHIPPNVANAMRYHETQKACETWLLDRLEEKDVATLQTLRFNQSGMRALIQFFKSKRIDITSIEHRDKKEDTCLSCWNMGR